jgi:hypothetical protein
MAIYMILQYLTIESELSGVDLGDVEASPNSPLDFISMHEKRRWIT